MTFSLHVRGRWPDPDTVMSIQRALFGLVMVLSDEIIQGDSVDGVGGRVRRVLLWF